MASCLLHPPNSTQELRTVVALRWWFQHFQEPLVWLGDVGLEPMKVCLMVYLSYGFMWWFFSFIIYMNIYDTCLWLHCGVCFLHLFSRKYICQKHTTSFNIALDVSGVPHPKKNNSMRLKGDEVSDSTELHVEHRGLPIAFWLALIQPHSRESQLQWAIWE